MYHWLFAPGVQLRVGCAAFVRSATDDVCWVQDCDIDVGRRTFDLVQYPDACHFQLVVLHHVDLHKAGRDVWSLRIAISRASCQISTNPWNLCGLCHLLSALTRTRLDPLLAMYRIVVCRWFPSIPFVFAVIVNTFSQSSHLITAHLVLS